MPARRTLASLLGATLTLTLCPTAARALTIQQVTQHGYIVVDEPNAALPYNGSAGAASTGAFTSFLSDLTNTLSAAGAPPADYIAIMQGSFEPQVLAFYLRVRNRTRGVGDHNPQGGSSEVYDLNPLIGLSFDVDGALFLNSPNIYVGGFGPYGTQVICPQEFGHRFLAQIHVPPYPLVPTDDGGVDAAMAGDASTEAATDDTGASDGNPDAAPADDASADDANTMDVPADLGPPNATDILLGRDRAHWSYFMNTGGSPVEGNAWQEITPGDFRTVPVNVAFSPLDLYLMGLQPASFVSPFFVITNPDVMGTLDDNGNVINRASPPEDFSGSTPRIVEITGTRVTYGINDVIAANGPRVPAYYDPDSGFDAGADAGTEWNVREMRVMWVLLTTSDQVRYGTASQFDRAIEACSMGYQTATGGLAHLTAVVMPQPDAGTDAGTDAGMEAAVIDASGDTFVPPQLRASGGCGCTTTPGGALPSNLASGALAFGFALLARRRRVRPKA